MKKLWLLAVLMLATSALAQASHYVQITWTESDTVSGITYTVYRGLGSCTPTMPTMTVLTSGITTLTSTDSTVVLGNTYCYYVTATVNGSQSNPSNAVSASINKVSPPVITITISQ